MTNSLDLRVRRIEDVMGLGGMGQGLADLRESVTRLEQQVNRNNAEKELGNLIVGGPIRTEIAHSAFTSGPYREGLDATFPIEFDLWVPDYLLRVVRCQCRLKPVPIRNSLKVVDDAPDTSSGASSSTTSGSSSASSSGASDTTSSGASSNGSSGSSSSTTTSSHTIGVISSGATSSLISGLEDTHFHTFLDYVSNTDFGYTGRLFTTRFGHEIFVQASAAENMDTFGGLGTTFAIPTAGHTHSTNIPGHSHGMEHVHTIPHTHNIQHTHTIPHTHTMSHTHTVPGHGHATTLGISEGGTASSLRFYIDGVDRSVVLGGPWGAAAVFDITPYLLNVRGEPILGAHPIQITSATVGAVEVWFDWLVIAKPNV